MPGYNHQLIVRVASLPAFPRRLASCWLLAAVLLAHGCAGTDAQGDAADGSDNVELDSQSDLGSV